MSKFVVNKDCVFRFRNRIRMLVSLGQTLDETRPYTR